MSPDTPSSSLCSGISPAPRAAPPRLIPLFFKTGDRHGYAASVVPLLVFFGRHDQTSYQVQFPLFWRFADERDHSSTTVTPLGFFGTGSRTDGAWAWARCCPWSGRRRGTEGALRAVPPAVALPGRHRRPHHHRAWRTSCIDATAARPPTRSSRSSITGAARARAAATRPRFTLFPLVHYHRDATRRWLVTPLGASAAGPERQAGFVGPYFWYHGKIFTARGVPGLYADVTRADTGERTRQVGPFVAIDGPEDRQHARAVPALRAPPRPHRDRHLRLPDVLPPAQG